MGTPLARPLENIRALLRRADEFEFHQLVRILRRLNPNADLLVKAGATGLRADAIISSAQVSRSGDATIELNPAAFFDTCEVLASAEAAMRRHELWEAAHPFVQVERGSLEGDQFIKECRLFAAASPVSVPADYVAYTAGSIRAGVNVSEICTDYFDVPVSFEPIHGSRARLRVGPVTWEQYRQFLPHSKSTVSHQLLELASAVVGTGTTFEVTFVLPDEEVPGCVPGSSGAVVGESAWPGRKGKRGGCLEQTFDAKDWSAHRD